MHFCHLFTLFKIHCGLNMKSDDCIVLMLNQAFNKQVLPKQNEHFQGNVLVY